MLYRAPGGRRREQRNCAGAAVAGRATQKKEDRSVPDFRCRERQKHFGSDEGIRKIGGAGEREIAQTIVQENGDRLVGPCGRYDDVGETISIYVVRDDFQSASWRGDADHLARAATETKRDPVARTACVTLADIYDGEVWAVVAVEIGNGKMRSCPRREP